MSRGFACVDVWGIRNLISTPGGVLDQFTLKTYENVLRATCCPAAVRHAYAVVRVDGVLGAHASMAAALLLLGFGHALPRRET